jgi:heme exporter protein D
MDASGSGSLVWLLAGLTLLIVLVAVIYQAVRTKRKQQKLGETGPGANVRMPPENRRH